MSNGNPSDGSVVYPPLSSARPFDVLPKAMNITGLTSQSPVSGVVESGARLLTQGDMRSLYQTQSESSPGVITIGQPLNVFNGAVYPYGTATHAIIHSPTSAGVINDFRASGAAVCIPRMAETALQTGVLTAAAEPLHFGALTVGGQRPIGSASLLSAVSQGTIVPEFIKANVTAPVVDWSYRAAINPDRLVAGAPSLRDFTRATVVDDQAQVTTLRADVVALRAELRTVGDRVRQLEREGATPIQATVEAQSAEIIALKESNDVLAASLRESREETRKLREEKFLREEKKFSAPMAPPNLHENKYSPN